MALILLPRDFHTTTHNHVPPTQISSSSYPSYSPTYALPTPSTAGMVTMTFPVCPPVESIFYAPVSHTPLDHIADVLARWGVHPHRKSFQKNLLTMAFWNFASFRDWVESHYSEDVYLGEQVGMDGFVSLQNLDELSERLHEMKTGYDVPIGRNMSPDMLPWIKSNLVDRRFELKNETYGMTVVFEHEDDATLFRLRWVEAGTEIA